MLPALCISKVELFAALSFRSRGILLRGTQNGGSVAQRQFCRLRQNCAARDRLLSVWMNSIVYISSVCELACGARELLRSDKCLPTVTGLWSLWT